MMYIVFRQWKFAFSGGSRRSRGCSGPTPHSPCIYLHRVCQKKNHWKNRAFFGKRHPPGHWQISGFMPERILDHCPPLLEEISGRGVMEMTWHGSAIWWRMPSANATRANFNFMWGKKAYSPCRIAIFTAQFTRHSATEATWSLTEKLLHKPPLSKLSTSSI